MQKIKSVLICILLGAVLSACSEGVPKIEGMIYIPAGEFILGSDALDTEGLGKEFGSRTGSFFVDSAPPRKVSIDGFYIDLYEVTNTQYKSFVDATGYRAPLKWEGGTYPEGKQSHPVNNITWYGAKNYCTWAGKRLPSELEWEKAARGPDGNEYPWGGEYDEKKANFNTGETSAVGSHKNDKSHYGVYDMGGNVMEWVEDWYKPYPGNTAEIKDYGETSKVLRGGSGTVLGHYMMEQIFSRTYFRHFYIPDGAGDDGGTRCAKSASSG